MDGGGSEPSAPPGASPANAGGSAAAQRRQMRVQLPQTLNITVQPHMQPGEIRTMLPINAAVGLPIRFWLPPNSQAGDRVVLKYELMGPPQAMRPPGSNMTSGGPGPAVPREAWREGDGRADPEFAAAMAMSRIYSEGSAQNATSAGGELVAATESIQAASGDALQPDGPLDEDDRDTALAMSLAEEPAEAAAVTHRPRRELQQLAGVGPAAAARLLAEHGGVQAALAAVTAPGGGELAAPAPSNPAVAAAGAVEPLQKLSSGKRSPPGSGAPEEGVRTAVQEFMNAVASNNVGKATALLAAHPGQVDFLSGLRRNPAAYTRVDRVAIAISPLPGNAIFCV